MKILFWCEIFLPHVGGIETSIRQLVEALVAEGHACEVITNRHSLELAQREEMYGAMVHRLDVITAMTSGSPRELHRLSQEVREIMQRFTPDVHHLFLAGPMLNLLRMANRSPKIPVVTSLQSPWADLLAGGAGVLQTLRDSSAVVTSSEMLRREVCDKLPEVASRVQFLLPAVEEPKEPPAPLPWDPPTLLCLGRVVKEKGFDLALQALAKLGPEFRHVRLRIVGDGPDHPELKSLAAQLDLSDRVDFSPSISHSEVPQVLNKTTVMLVPSRWQEPSGMVILHAALMKRPVIATRVGGIPEVVDDGKTGLLVENDNPDPLAAAIEALMLDPAGTEAMGSHAKARVVELFGFGAYFAKHIELYSECRQAASAVLI